LKRKLFYFQTSFPATKLLSKKAQLQLRELVHQEKVKNCTVCQSPNYVQSEIYFLIKHLLNLCQLVHWKSENTSIRGKTLSAAVQIKPQNPAQITQFGAFFPQVELL
jgi:hypothetical protein